MYQDLVQDPVALSSTIAALHPQLLAALSYGAGAGGSGGNVGPIPKREPPDAARKREAEERHRPQQDNSHHCVLWREGKGCTKRGALNSMRGHARCACGTNSMAFKAHIDKDQWQFRVGGGWHAEITIKMQYAVIYEMPSAVNNESVPEGVEKAADLMLGAAVRKAQELDASTNGGMSLLQTYFGRTASKKSVLSVPAGMLWNKAKDGSSFDSECRPSRYISLVEIKDAHIKFRLHVQKKAVLDALEQVPGSTPL